ncbi:MAG: UTP--glucose-1-phosphate uridylyltransferase [Pseudomonadota bacterium]
MDLTPIEKYLPALVLKMKNEGLPQIAIDTFSYYYSQIVSGETGLIRDADIRPIDPAEIEDCRNLADYSNAGRKALPRSVRMMLNGGLGTSMGLKTTKSLINIKDGKSFLEIIVEQSELQNIQLVLMNSFNTHRETVEAVSSLRPARPPILFVQHKFPKILQETLAPASWPDNPELEWNPPGHGNLFVALAESGTLSRLMDSGIEYAFVSNSDNLGADMDETLLGYFASNGFPFMMEVARRTPADIKGGHLAKHVDGRLILRESAQCPKDELKAFQDIRFYRYFNTNNIWINLKFLSRLLEKEGNVVLPLILNRKTLDPRDDHSPMVYQVESAVGAAISLFEGATAVIVPKSRLVPVKKCNDLFLVASDCFILNSQKRLIWNPERTTETIRIDLDPNFYGKIDLLEERINSGVPSLLNCESLTIRGDVRFEKGVTICGTVRIENRNATQAVIKEKSVVDRDLIFY